MIWELISFLYSCWKMFTYACHSGEDARRCCKRRSFSIFKTMRVNLKSLTDKNDILYHQDIIMQINLCNLQLSLDSFVILLFPKYIILSLLNWIPHTTDAAQCLQKQNILNPYLNHFFCLITTVVFVMSWYRL